MQLLLSSDELRVPSEDTVVYTAQQYVEAQRRPSRKAAQAALAQLIRAPHLSRFALSCAASASNDTQMLLGSKVPQLQELLFIQQAAEDQVDFRLGIQSNFLSTGLLAAVQPTVTLVRRGEGGVVSASRKSSRGVQTSLCTAGTTCLLWPKQRTTGRDHLAASCCH